MPIEKSLSLCMAQDLLCRACRRTGMFRWTLHAKLHSVIVNICWTTDCGR